MKPLLVAIWIATVKYTTASDPDIALSTPEMIKRQGYPVESHTIQTEDGYLLTAFRIPYSIHSTENITKRPAALIQHGLFDSSADFVLLRSPKALAYKLSDEGYDVWLGNLRGTIYSQGHNALHCSDTEYWNFSWDEMGEYDIPSVIDYILKVTDHKTLSYVGHSLGTTVFYAMASTKPEYNKKVNVMVTLAPVIYLSHKISPINIISPLLYHRNKIVNFLVGKGSFSPRRFLIKLISIPLCFLMDIEASVCDNVIYLVAVGYNPTQLKKKSISRILSHLNQGASTKTVTHLAQQMYSGGFSKYDYGPAKNQLKYDQVTPPDYDISKITTPIAVFWAKQDTYLSKIDLKILTEQIQRKIGVFEVPDPSFTHNDILYGKDADKLVYNHVVKILNDFQ